MQSPAAPQAGYIGQRKSPLGIGGTIAVHLVVAGVIVMMPREMIDRFTPGPTPVTFIPLPPPPPEQPRIEHQKPRPFEKSDPIPDRLPDVLIPALPPLDFGLDSGLDTATTTGTGEASGDAVDPPRAPILMDAAPDPRYARGFQPDYPPSMQRAQEEGKVTVRIRIGSDGRVLAVEKLFATNAAFWDVTERQALRAWRFRPATRDGVPVEALRVMTVHFRLGAD